MKTLGLSTRPAQRRFLNRKAENRYCQLHHILRYAPLYYPNYKIEINSGQQFLFSITYADVPNDGQMSNEKPSVHEQMSATDTNDILCSRQMSAIEAESVRNGDKMSAINVQELSEEELSLKPFEREIVISKRNRRKQAIMGMISQNPHVGVEAMAERLDVNEKTIRRDIGELKRAGVF